MRALLLNSGGIDSRLTAAYLVRQGWEFSSLYLDLGHPSVERAKRAAERTAGFFGMPHRVVTISWPVPVVGEYTNVKGFSTVPFTIMLALIHGATMARALGLEYVATGAKREVWGDGVVRTAQAFLAEVRFCEPITFVAPFGDVSGYKAVIDRCPPDGLPLDDTVSCAWDQACGTCPKCRERIELGILAG